MKRARRKGKDLGDRSPPTLEGKEANAEAGGH